MIYMNGFGAHILEAQSILNRRWDNGHLCLGQVHSDICIILAGDFTSWVKPSRVIVESQEECGFSKSVLNLLVQEYQHGV